MSFKLDDIIVDRIQMAVAEDFDGNVLYTLTQLSDATIEVSAESKDATDAQGTLIKRFWQSKSGSFSATNAMLNLNVIAAASGTDKQISSATNSIVMPKVAIVKNTAGADTLDITGFVDGTITVNALGGNGALGDAFEKGSSASATKYAIATSEGVSTLTLPTADVADVAQFVVTYDRTVTTDGIAIYNSADKFPETVKLTLKCLIVDPCDADTLRAAYIVMPSFQVSPEVSVQLTTDANLDYKGDLQVNFCDADKALYQIYICYDDEE